MYINQYFTLKVAALSLGRNRNDLLLCKRSRTTGTVDRRLAHYRPIATPSRLGSAAPSK